MKLPINYEAFFLRSVYKTNHCWNWLGCKTIDGYGRPKINGSSYYAHRVAFFLWRVKIPAKMCVCHSCDNPACVNPAHLWLGTHTDNMADMKAKGRQKCPRFPGDETATKQRKISPEFIPKIISDTRIHRVIAADYGVSQQTISDIKNRLKYKDVKI